MPKNGAECPQNCQQKSDKELVSDVLKETLERKRVAHKAFSRYDTICRDANRQILEKYGVFQEILQQKLV